MNDALGNSPGSKSSSQEESDLEQLCEYLISEGKYDNIQSARADALERVKFFDDLKLYGKDPEMKDASMTHKMIHALIYGHELHDVIERNNGALPKAKQPPRTPNAQEPCTSQSKGPEIPSFYLFLIFALIVAAGYLASSLGWGA